MIFKKRELLKPTLFQRLLKKKPEENLIIEILNYFFENEGTIEDIKIEKILSLASSYGLNLNNKFLNERLLIYKDYLIFCLKDEVLEDYEVKNLKHIQNVLLLKETDTNPIINKEVTKIYERQVSDAVSDGILTDEEKTKLEKVKKDLLLDESLAEEIYGVKTEEIMQKILSNMVEDKRLSPIEESELNAVSKSLGVEIEYSEKTTLLLEKYKLFWKIENAELPIIESDINIQKSEVLHFKSNIKWLEQRKVTKRINYSGPSMRIKIAKGIYYGAGSLSVQSVSEDVWETIDTGIIYLTNKRLIFTGSASNKTIALNKVLDLVPFINGVSIQKESGRPPFFEFEANSDIFSMILARLLNEI